MVLSERKLADKKNTQKSFEASFGSGKGLVQATFIPVLDEKKAEQRRLAELRRSRQSKESSVHSIARDRDSIRDDQSYMTVPKAPPTPFVEQYSMSASPMPLSP